MSEQLTHSYWPAEPSTGVRDITLPELLREAAAAAPQRLALVDALPDLSARRHWTYAQYLADVERCSHALLARFTPGDRIAIWAPNSANWVILQQAIAMAGMIVVAVNPAFKSSELEYVLCHSRAVGLFYVTSHRGVDLGAMVQEVLPGTPDLAQLISLDEWEKFLASGDPGQPLPEVKPLDPVQIQYTSGTTGFPKGAILHHKGIVNEASFVGERAGMSDGAVCINAMPMYHIGGGAVTELQTISAHGTYVVMPGFDPALTLELFETYRGTHSLMVPTMLLAVLEHPDSQTRDMSSTQTIMSGAAAVSEALVKRVIDRWGCQFSILFGQTEMHGVTNQTRITDAPADQATTVGKPLPELEMKIVDPDTGEIVPIGVQGEICARGYQNMLGYDQMPEQTRATIDAGGWLHMGDLGIMDNRGFLKVTGRLKDMIIRGGVNLYPLEIEELLAGHPAIADLVVVGVPDERWGEEVGAVIRLRAGAAKPDIHVLKTWCRERISAHKTPSRWYFVEEYPQTPSGKIQKFALLERIERGDLVAAAAVPVTAVTQPPAARELLTGASMSLTIVERIAHLELTRPQKRNAMDPAFVNDMVAVLDAVEAEETVRALLITAQGPSFCVGGDLAYFAGRPETHAVDLGWMVDHWHRVLGRLARVSVPVITAVHGGTAGGGLGLVWCADHVIAAESTRMAGGFADIGLSGDGGASWHLPRLVGLRRAQSMILDNEVIDAGQALSWGIVNRVVPDAELESSAWEAAQRFAHRSATAFSRAKSLLFESSTNGYIEHLEAEARAIHECVAESDVTTGIQAFLAKKPPAFTDPYRHSVQR